MQAQMDRTTERNTFRLQKWERGEEKNGGDLKRQHKREKIREAVGSAVQ